MKKLGIYIHIPFCLKKCKYCDFVSFQNKDKKLIERYILALIKTIDNVSERLDVNTIYIGGGTPSYIDEKYIVMILEKLKEKFNVIEDAEITIEINPGTINESKIETYYKYGINRISIGLQSTKNEILKKIGRIHTFEKFLETYEMVKKVGFNNINVDLMLALPNQDIKDIKESLTQIIKLNPSHISLYSLILEEGTELEKEVNQGILNIPSEEIERQMYHTTKRILESNGYKHYEISNFAKENFESKHNLNCWNQEEYLGFGIASHSYIDNKRFSNIDNIEKFINNVEDGKNNIIINEKQTKESKMKEYMMLGFRKIEGISISEFERKFIINPLFYFRFEISKLEKEKLIEVDLDNIRLTKKGLDFANMVFEKFV